MMGGILHDAGYFTGPDLYPPREGNPKGFFESPRINRINELILEKYDPGRNKTFFPFVRHLRRYGINNLCFGQRWLSSIPLDTAIECSDSKILNEIEQVVCHQPFAYKDPRFSYTLPVWQPFLDDDTLFICIFRSPDSTIQSIIKECRNAPNLKRFEISTDQACEIWSNMYSHILKKHATPGKMFFVHYLQILRGEVFSALSDFLETPLRSDFVDPSLNRTPPRSENQYAPHVRDIYVELCKRAGFVP